MCVGYNKYSDGESQYGGKIELLRAGAWLFDHTA